MRAVVPSVGYADFLATTLPAWVAVLPPDTLTVVTSPADEATVRVAEQCGARVCVTDIWRREGAQLNKGGALNVAFGFDGGAPPSAGELCLSIDADSFPCGTWPRDAEIQPDVLYGCARYHCLTPADLEAHRLGRTPRASLALIPPKVRGSSYGEIPHTPQNVTQTAQKCLGYFQLWRSSPRYRFAPSKTAGGYDMRFRDQFPVRRALIGFYILHLGPQNRANWQGRILPTWGDG